MCLGGTFYKLQDHLINDIHISYRTECIGEDACKLHNSIKLAHCSSDLHPVRRDLSLNASSLKNAISTEFSQWRIESILGVFKGVFSLYALGLA